MNELMDSLIKQYTQDDSKLNETTKAEIFKWIEENTDGLIVTIGMTAPAVAKAFPDLEIGQAREAVRMYKEEKGIKFDESVESKKVNEKSLPAAEFIEEMEDMTWHILEVFEKVPTYDSANETPGISKALHAVDAEFRKTHSAAKNLNYIITTNKPVITGAVEESVNEADDKKFLMQSEIIKEEGYMDARVIMWSYPAAQNKPNEYVTHVYTPENGGKYWGHYFQDKDKAVEDFKKRCKEYNVEPEVSESRVNETDEERDELWDYLLSREIATEDELRLVTNINGFTKESLESIIYAKTGYRSLEQLKDEYDDANESKSVNESSKLDDMAAHIGKTLSVPVKEELSDYDVGSKLFEIVFRDEYRADSEEEVYAKFLAYLRDVVENEDVTAFQFYELKPKKEG